MAQTGQCLCGAVKFQGEGQMGAPHVCHCTACVRWTGGPFMGVQFEGGLKIAGAASVNWYASSDWADRGSCKTCGTILFWRLRDNPDFTIVTAGSLNDKAALAPIEEHIFSDHKAAFYEFADDTPRVTAAEVFARLEGQFDD